MAPCCRQMSLTAGSGETTIVPSTCSESTMVCITCFSVRRLRVLLWVGLMMLDSRVLVLVRDLTGMITYSPLGIVYASARSTGRESGDKSLVISQCFPLGVTSRRPWFVALMATWSHTFLWSLPLPR